MNDIRIRAVCASDVECLLRWRNDKEIFRYLGGGYNPVTKEKQTEIVNAMIKDNAEGKARRYIIENSGEKIGFVGLYDINKLNATCEFGIYIGEKKEWGKGYAKQAYRLAEKEAKDLGIRKIKLYVVRENVSAVKMYEKLHFREIGFFEKERLIDGVYHDVIIMEKII